MTRKLRPEDVLYCFPEVQLASHGWNTVLRHRAGITLLQDTPPGDVRKVLGQVDGRRDAATICDLLSTELEPADTRRILRGLLGEVLQRRRTTPPGPTDHLPGRPDRGDVPAAGRPAQIGLLGTGHAARRLREQLTGLQLLWRQLEANNATDPFPAHALQDLDLVLAIGDGPSYHHLLALQRAALGADVPALFITIDGDGLRCGPSTIPGHSPCLSCAQLASLALLRRPPQDLLHIAEQFETTDLASLPSDLTRDVAQEVRALLDPNGNPRFTSHVLLRRWDGPSRLLPVPRRADCPLCGTLPATGSSPLGRRLERRAIEVQERSPRLARAAEETPLVRTVGILGGGTAGYLAALALCRHRPELEVTLLESSQIPVIGVGEATTPLMPQFLHVDLGLDIHSFFRRVEPTLKLGIRFAWGPEETHSFNYPFGPNRVLEAQAFEGHLRHASLQGMLMDAGAVPLEFPAQFDGPPAPPHSHLGTEVAYHLDNRRFVHYLKEQAQRLGTHLVDAQIVDVEVDGGGEEGDENGGEIRTLIADDGRRFSFDLYLDCSGFRSLLLGKALGSPFRSYEGSLFTDRAVVATAPHGGTVAPHTEARAMDAGWCWNTPQRGEDHRGYVFCSAFLSDGEAIEEMRRKNPGLGPPRLIPFRPGRREHFVRGNVVALGNAYGFVEPLESTALHMLIRQLGLLLQAFPVHRGEGHRGARGLAATLNRRLGASWDYLRWFLALHYRFNRALDTPFWKHCRTAVDVSSHGELLAAFAERGPLSYDPALRSAFDYPDPLWGPEGIDVILLGQGVPTRLPSPAVDRAAWNAHVQRCRRAVGRSMPQAEALQQLAHHPELLEAFAAAFRRTGPAFGASPRSVDPTI